MNEEGQSTAGGLGGTLRLVGMFVVLVLAGFAAALVLDVISQDQLKELGTKVGLLVAIGVGAVFAIAALMRGRR
ncbi:MAG: hypothetical protein ACK5TE_03635 [Pseudomonadota bacterium]|jgi:hypothetical protein